MQVFNFHVDRSVFMFFHLYVYYKYSKFSSKSGRRQLLIYLKLILVQGMSDNPYLFPKDPFPPNFNISVYWNIVPFLCDVKRHVLYSHMFLSFLWANIFHCQMLLGLK